MAVQNYSPVQWNGEDIELDKLKQMANNDQFLFENMPKMLFKGSISKAGGIRILAGRAPVPANPTKMYSSKEVYFGSFFTSGCQPIVVATPRAEGGNYGSKKLITVKGLGKSDPDHRGASLIYHSAEAANAPIQARTVRGGVIYWIAIGW